MNTEFNYDGTIYYFDLNKVCEFVSYTNEKTEKEKEIVDSYDLDNEEGGIKLSSKIIREITSPNSSQFDNIKYDLIKTFIIQLITYADKTTVVDGNNTEVEVPVTNVQFMPLGTRIVFNTLIEEKLLIKKEE